MKYVIDEDHNFIIFNQIGNTFSHRDVGMFLGNIKSAGFIHIDVFTHTIKCSGRSDTLNIDSDENDSHIFMTILTDRIYHIHGSEYIVFASNLPNHHFNSLNTETAVENATIDDVVCL